jgi:uncharacterized protein (DUF58 family)
LTTALTHLVSLGRDAVGLAVVGRELERYIPPSCSVQHRALLHAVVEQLQCQGTTDLARGLDDVLTQAKRRGVLVVVSDFLVDNIEAVAAGLRKFRARGWEIIALHLVHPDEQKLPAGNAFRFTGLENDGSINCQLTEIRAAYEERFEQHLKMTRSMLVSTGCEYQLASTAEDYLDVLRSFLVVRSS